MHRNVTYLNQELYLLAIQILNMSCFFNCENVLRRHMHFTQLLLDGTQSICHQTPTDKMLLYQHTISFCSVLIMSYFVFSNVESIICTASDLLFFNIIYFFLIIQTCRFIYRSFLLFRPSLLKVYFFYFSIILKLVPVL